MKITLTDAERAAGFGDVKCKCGKRKNRFQPQCNKCLAALAVATLAKLEKLRAEAAGEPVGVSDQAQTE